MSAYIINGKECATILQNTLTEKVRTLKASCGYSPKISVILVGNDPASHIYVQHKTLRASLVGVQSDCWHLSEETTEKELLDVIETLNTDETVDGILLQLPLPKGLHAQTFIRAIDPKKDVDGLSPVNRGLLFEKSSNGFIPCTPLGVYHLIRTVMPDITGQHAVIIGRSLLVGQPLAHVLLNHNATVTVTHSHTQYLKERCREADILIAAVGHPHLVQGDWVKPGAIVIDVGINRIMQEDGKSRLIGDIVYDEAKEIARAITPVPGGVGPMTVTYLLFNTLKAAYIKCGLFSSFHDMNGCTHIK